MVQKTRFWLETWGVNVNREGHLHLVSIRIHLFRGHPWRGVCVRTLWQLENKPSVELDRNNHRVSGF